MAADWPNVVRNSIVASRLPVPAPCALARMARNPDPDGRSPRFMALLHSYYARRSGIRGPFSDDL